MISLVPTALDVNGLIFDPKFMWIFWRLDIWYFFKNESIHTWLIKNFMHETLWNGRCAQLVHILISLISFWKFLWFKANILVFFAHFGTFRADDECEKINFTINDFKKLTSKLQNRWLKISETHLLKLIGWPDGSKINNTIGATPKKRLSCFRKKHMKPLSPKASFSQSQRSLNGLSLCISKARFGAITWCTSKENFQTHPRQKLR